jgi:hypothetical protein
VRKKATWRVAAAAFLIVAVEVVILLAPRNEPSRPGGPYHVTGGNPAPPAPNSWLLDASLMGNPLASVDYAGGALTFYQSWVVGYYYDEVPIKLDPTTKIWGPGLTVISADFIDGVRLQGGSGYVIGFAAYTYKDVDGKNLPVPDFDLVYEVTDTDGDKFTISGNSLIPSSAGLQKTATTATDDATGLHALWWLIPDEIDGAPDCIPFSEVRVRVHLGIAGEIKVEHGAVRNELILAWSAPFHCQEDRANHRVALDKKFGGGYFTTADEKRYSSDRVWLTPEEAEKILGRKLTPAFTLPTGQEYYDAYRPSMDKWDVNPADLKGVTPDMTDAEALNLIGNNKFERETGQPADESENAVPDESEMWFDIFAGGFGGMTG